jgi:putative copper export protein
MRCPDDHGRDKNGRVIDFDWDTVRLFLHVLAATVWVGGQLTLAALVPALRAASPDAPRAAAQAFNRVAWSAFAVLVLTGIWNVADQPDDTTDGYDITLGVKLVVVAASGVTAYLHTRATTPRQRGVYGGLTALTAIAALFLGVLLHG